MFVHVNQQQITYLLEQQRNQQWEFFLQPLAQVFTQKLNQQDLHELMHSIGLEASEKISIEGVSTLDELEIVLNHFWQNIQWGIITLEEANNALQITHYYPPLILTFDEKDYIWVTGFLEGVYQGVFQRLGAGSSLKVTWSAEKKENCLTFKFSS